MNSSESYIKKQASHRLWGLDFLRCLAIVAVVLSHYPKAKDQLILKALGHYGWSGVDLFFVLSGFLIGNQFFKEFLQSGEFRLKRFYMRRFFRTLPNYYIMLAIIIFVLPKIFPAYPVVDNVWPFVFFLQNFGIPQTFTPSWSLCIEEHFYLFFPLVALYIVKKVQTFKGVCWVVASILGLEVVIRVALWFYYEPAKAFASNPDLGNEIHLANIYYPTHTRLDGLTVGVFLAYAKNFSPETWSRWIANSTKNFVIGAVTVLVGLGISYSRVPLLPTAFCYTLLAIGFGFMTLSALGKNSPYEKLKIPGVHFIAILSYSIYLTHIIAIDIGRELGRHFGFADFGFAQGGIKVLFILFFGYLLYAGIEKPFLKLRDRFHG